MGINCTLEIVFALAIPILIFGMNWTASRLITDKTTFGLTDRHVPNSIVHEHLAKNVLGFELCLMSIPYFVLYFSLKDVIITKYSFLDANFFDKLILTLAVIALIATFSSLNIACNVKAKEKQRELIAKRKILNKASITRYGLKYIDPECETLLKISTSDSSMYTYIAKDGFKTNRNSLFDLTRCSRKRVVISYEQKQRALAGAIGATVIFLSVFYFPILNIINIIYNA